MKELFQFESELFKALAHPSRLAILEALRTGEKSVNELAEILSLEPTTTSQQLAILRGKNLVVGTKEGTRVAYSVKDPLIYNVLDDARRIFDNHLVDTLTSWKEIKRTLKAGID